jgi:hypothetical protein
MHKMTTRVRVCVRTRTRHPQNRGCWGEYFYRGWTSNRKRGELQNEELHSFCCSQTIITLNTSYRITWVGNITWMRNRRNAYKVCLNIWRDETTGYLVSEGRAVLKWIINKYDSRMWTGFTWLRIRSNELLLLTRKYTLIFYKWCEISWRAQLLSCFQEGLCSLLSAMEPVSVTVTEGAHYSNKRIKTN